MPDLLETTKDLCRLYGIVPARSKGQNFLIREEVYDQVINAAELSPDDLVLEVGPGLGFLTAKLAERAGRVVAVELDDKLAGYLKTAVSTQKLANVSVFNGNVLDLEVAGLSAGGQQYKIVANLPYNISSVFLRKFVSEIKHKPESLVLLLQKEVAERIVARPGEMSLLALSIQFYAEAELVGYVPAAAFWPAPKVESAIIRIRLMDQALRQESGLAGIEEKKFFRLARFGFSAKRKMLKNNLAAGLHLAPAAVAGRLAGIGLKENARAEDLSLADWVKLSSLF